MQIKHTTDLTDPIYRDALALRRTVFIDEQGVAENREIDADEGKAIHFVAYDQDTPIGTARLLPESYGYHVQRVAVLKSQRGQGTGAQLLAALAAYATANGAHELRLGAQVHALGFYQRQGYSLTERPEFLDAGIRHREMRKSLAASDQQAG